MSQTRAQIISPVGILTASDINVSGVITASSFSGNLTGNATGLSGTPNLNVGVVTASSFVGNGAGLTGVGVGASDSINTTGIITASSFVGNLTGTATGLSGTPNVVLGIATVSAGSTSAPSITPTGDSNTGIFFPSADTIAFTKGGVEAARFDSSGRFGVGTASPSSLLTCGTTTGANAFSILAPGVSEAIFSLESASPNALAASANGFAWKVWNGSTYAERARIDSSGRLLVGTFTSSGNIWLQESLALVRTGSGYGGASFTNYPGTAAGESAMLNFQRSRGTTDGSYTSVASGDALGFINFRGADGSAFVNSARISAEVDGTPGTNDMPGRLVFSTTADGASSPTERVRIDSQGRMGVGTNSPNSLIHVLDSVGSSRISIESSGSGGVLATFTAERSGGLRIASESAAGWLAFNTGQSGTTERMRLDSGGALRHTGSGSISVTTGYSTVGCAMEPNGTLLVTRSSAGPGFFNRLTDDGTLVVFAQDTVTEGTISVSGTTVSYNGAHLSRWSQLVNVDPYDKTQRPEILRGTIMSNLDEMCEWIDPETGEAQDNEQLNKTEISSVEDDPNVAGVFQSWDDDDNTWVNDYYLAMTGDFVIRIAEGVEVNRGDLLISAGDGTAKPQGDRYLKDSTIAKVTSTNVICTYDDGSYCVPCVLMAC